MKRMKKIFAMLLAFTMVLGMTMTASAAVPAESDTAKATVYNVEKDATVTAYQIVKAKYAHADGTGFVGYEKAAEELEIADIHKPTAKEVAEIAKDTEGLVAKPMNQTSETIKGDAVYQADLEAGYWIVLVRGTVRVYNPILLGVYYSEEGSGSDNSLESDKVDVKGNWTLTSDATYAKSTEPTIEKTANVQTQNVGGTVNFEIKTTIPDYSTEYTTAKFEIADTLTNLLLVKNPINSKADPIVKVEVDGKDVTENTEICTITGNTEKSNEFKVQFKSSWLLERTLVEGEKTGIAVNAGKEVKVTYTAVLTDGALNQDEASNEATITYTNNPTGGEGYDKDIEKVYTFDIDGSVTNNIIKKVKEDTTEGSFVALPDATFTMYTAMKELGANEDIIYSNTDNTDDLVNTGAEGAGTVKSNADGLLHIAGLNAGTYYLKETAAPAGFSLNDTIYKIEITPTFSSEAGKEEELTSWTIVVTPYVKENNVYEAKTADAKTSKFDVNQKTEEVDGKIVIKESIGFSQELTQIINTELIKLPSTGGIGTTIFTVAGCGIMIAAAFFFLAGRKKEN